MANKNIVRGNIGNALHSVAPDHIVTTSDEVFDEMLQMYQNEINFLDGVFDISVYNLTDGQPTKYADLAAALGTNGANVPESYRRGGMTVKYVQSSDNKYIQARCVAQNFTTDVTQWQGVDEEPTVGSDNPVKSGGVATSQKVIANVVLNQFSTTRLASGFYDNMDYLSSLWLSDDVAYECVAVGGNSKNYNGGTLLTSWGSGKDVTSNAIKACTYKYCWLFVRNKTNPNGEIIVGDVTLQGALIISAKDTQNAIGKLAGDVKETIGAIEKTEKCLLKTSEDYSLAYLITSSGGPVPNDKRLVNNFPISYKEGVEIIRAKGNYFFYACFYNDNRYSSYAGFIDVSGNLTTDSSREQLLMQYFDLSKYPNYYVAITIKDVDNPDSDMLPAQGTNIIIGYNKHQQDYSIVGSTKDELENEEIKEPLYQYSSNRLVSRLFSVTKDSETIKNYWIDKEGFSIIIWCKNTIWNSASIIGSWFSSRAYYEYFLESLIQSYNYFGFYIKKDNDENITPSDVSFSSKTILFDITHRNNISLTWFVSSGSPVKSRLISPTFIAEKTAALKDYWLSNDFEYELNLIESDSLNPNSGGSSLTGWTNKREVFVSALDNITKAFVHIFFRKFRNPNEEINSQDVLWLEYSGVSNEVVSNLNTLNKDYALLKGKTFAVMCDSIGTHGNSGVWHNVEEVVISAEDVGVELSAFLTHYDLYSGATQQDPVGTYTGLTIGGVTFTEDQIGTEITFTPTAEDIGKSVGKVYDWNGNDMDVWWVNLAKKTGMTPIPVCWASSSYSSHESTVQRLKTAHAWHDAQIRKCGVRIPGSMNRKAPDYIILARGCNDMTHAPYDRLTSDFFNPVDWDFPQTDIVDTDGFGLKEALSLTIKKLWAAYPFAKIILCTIPYVKRIDYDNFPTNNDTEQEPLSYASNYPQWNDAIREVADYFGCGLIDFSKDGVTHANLWWFTNDLTHPNAAGHALMGLEACKAFI